MRCPSYHNIRTTGAVIQKTWNQNQKWSREWSKLQHFSQELYTASGTWNIISNIRHSFYIWAFGAWLLGHHIQHPTFETLPLKSDILMSPEARIIRSKNWKHYAHTNAEFSPFVVKELQIPCLSRDRVILKTPHTFAATQHAAGPKLPANLKDESEGVTWRAFILSFAAPFHRQRGFIIIVIITICNSACNYYCR